MSRVPSEADEVFGASFFEASEESGEEMEGSGEGPAPRSATQRAPPRVCLPRMVSQGGRGLNKEVTFGSFEESEFEELEGSGEGSAPRSAQRAPPRVGPLHMVSQAADSRVVYSSPCDVVRNVAGLGEAGPGEGPAPQATGESRSSGHRPGNGLTPKMASDASGTAARTVSYVAGFGVAGPGEGSAPRMAGVARSSGLRPGTGSTALMISLDASGKAARIVSNIASFGEFGPGEGFAPQRTVGDRSSGPRPGTGPTSLRVSLGASGTAGRFVSNAASLGESGPGEGSAPQRTGGDRSSGPRPGNGPTAWRVSLDAGGSAGRIVTKVAEAAPLPPLRGADEESDGESPEMGAINDEGSAGARAGAAARLERGGAAGLGGPSARGPGGTAVAPAFSGDDHARAEAFASAEVWPKTSQADRSEVAAFARRAVSWAEVSSAIQADFPQLRGAAWPEGEGGVSRALWEILRFQRGARASPGTTHRCGRSGECAPAARALAVADAALVDEKVPIALRGALLRDVAAYARSLDGSFETWQPTLGPVGSPAGPRRSPRVRGPAGREAAPLAAAGPGAESAQPGRVRDWRRDLLPSTLRALGKNLCRDASAVEARYGPCYQRCFLFALLDLPSTTARTTARFEAIPDPPPGDYPCFHGARALPEGRPACVSEDARRAGTAFSRLRDRVAGLKLEREWVAVRPIILGRGLQAIQRAEVGARAGPCAQGCCVEEAAGCFISSLAARVDAAGGRDGSGESAYIQRVARRCSALRGHSCPAPALAHAKALFETVWEQCRATILAEQLEEWGLVRGAPFNFPAVWGRFPTAVRHLLIEAGLRPPAEERFCIGDTFAYLVDRAVWESPPLPGSVPAIPPFAPAGCGRWEPHVCCGQGVAEAYVFFAKLSALDAAPLTHADWATSALSVPPGLGRPGLPSENRPFSRSRPVEDAKIPEMPLMATRIWLDAAEECAAATLRALLASTAPPTHPSPRCLCGQNGCSAHSLAAAEAAYQRIWVPAGEIVQRAWKRQIRLGDSDYADLRMAMGDLPKRHGFVSPLGPGRSAPPRCPTGGTILPGEMSGCFVRRFLMLCFSGAPEGSEDRAAPRRERVESITPRPAVIEPGAAPRAASRLPEVNEPLTAAGATPPPAPAAIISKDVSPAGAVSSSRAPSPPVGGAEAANSRRTSPGAGGTQVARAAVKWGRALQQNCRDFATAAASLLTPAAAASMGSAMPRSAPGPSRPAAQTPQRPGGPVIGGVRPCSAPPPPPRAVYGDSGLALQLVTSLAENLSPFERLAVAGTVAASDSYATAYANLVSMSDAKWPLPKPGDMPDQEPYLLVHLRNLQYDARASVPTSAEGWASAQRALESHAAGYGGDWLARSVTARLAGMSIRERQGWSLQLACLSRDDGEARRRLMRQLCVGPGFGTLSDEALARADALLVSLHNLLDRHLDVLDSRVPSVDREVVGATVVTNAAGYELVGQSRHNALRRARKGRATEGGMPLTDAYDPFGRRFALIAVSHLDEITMRIAMILEHLQAQRANPHAYRDPIMDPIAVPFLRSLLSNLLMAIAGSPTSRLLVMGEAQGAQTVVLVGFAWAVELLCPLRLSTPQKDCPTSDGASSASGASTPRGGPSPPPSSPLSGAEVQRILFASPPRRGPPPRCPPVGPPLVMQAGSGPRPPPPPPLRAGGRASPPPRARAGSVSARPGGRGAGAGAGPVARGARTAEEEAGGAAPASGARRETLAATARGAPDAARAARAPLARAAPGDLARPVVSEPRTTAAGPAAHSSRNVGGASTTCRPGGASTTGRPAATGPAAQSKRRDGAARISYAGALPAPVDPACTSGGGGARG